MSNEFVLTVHWIDLHRLDPNDVAVVASQMRMLSLFFEVGCKPAAHFRTRACVAVSVVATFIVVLKRAQQLDPLCQGRDF